MVDRSWPMSVAVREVPGGADRSQKLQGPASRLCRTYSYPAGDCADRRCVQERSAAPEKTQQTVSRANLGPSPRAFSTSLEAYVLSILSLQLADSCASLGSVSGPTTQRRSGLCAKVFTLDSLLVSGLTCTRNPVPLNGIAQGKWGDGVQGIWRQSTVLGAAGETPGSDVHIADLVALSAGTQPRHTGLHRSHRAAKHNELNSD